MIQLRNIHYQYKKKPKIFENLDLQLHPGQVYGLLGKNGAGKSTLLKVLSGLLLPQTGSYMAFGKMVHERTPEFLKNIFIVPEEFELPAHSIATFTRYNAVFYENFSEANFLNYLKEFEISYQSKLSALSYGQKKKFLLAFGLATNTKLLILDEPTNGLDIPSKSQFRKIVAAAMNDEKAIVISTHQVRDLENLIEAIVVLEHGKIIFNQHLRTISEKLFFDNDVRNTSTAEIIFPADGLSRSGIRTNPHAEDSRIDLETLFNAIIQDSNNINKHFN